MCNVNENLAEYRYNRLEMLKERNKFYTDNLELVVKSQFDGFIKKYKWIKKQKKTIKFKKFNRL